MKNHGTMKVSECIISLYTKQATFLFLYFASDFDEGMTAWTSATTKHVNAVIRSSSDGKKKPQKTVVQLKRYLVINQCSFVFTCFYVTKSNMNSWLEEWPFLCAWFWPPQTVQLPPPPLDQCSLSVGLLVFFLPTQTLLWLPNVRTQFSFTESTIFILH